MKGESSTSETGSVEAEANVLQVYDENTLFAFRVVQLVMAEVNSRWQVKHRLLRPVQRLLTAPMERAILSFLKENRDQILKDVEKHEFYSDAESFRTSCRKLLKSYRERKYTQRAFLQLCTTIAYAACVALDRAVPEGPGIAIERISGMCRDVRKKGILEFSSW